MTGSSTYHNNSGSPSEPPAVEKSAGSAHGPAGGPRIPPEFYIFLFYLLVSLFLTWPLIVRFTTSIYGRPGDNLSGIWYMWWLRNAGSLGGSASFCPLVGFPFGARFGAVPMEPVEYAFTRFLMLFTGEVVAYNLQVLASFLLSGLTMYYLVRYVTSDRRAAFFGGFAYLMIPYHAYHAMYMGGGIIAVQWMPLYILLLIRFIERPGSWRALLLTAGAVLVTGTSLHYGLFMAVFTAAFLLGRFTYLRIRGRRKQPGVTGVRQTVTVNRRTLALSLVALLVTLVLILPFAYAGVLSLYKPGRWSTDPLPLHIRSVDQVWTFSATSLEYFIPSVENPVLGDASYRLLEDKGISGFGNSLYLGWVIIALSGLCLITASRGRHHLNDDTGCDGTAGGTTGSGKRRQNNPRPVEIRMPFVWGFTAAALVTFVLSLKPYVNIGSFRIPLPSRLFLLFVPWFRWYMRLGIVVGICGIVLACLGLQWVLDNVRRRPGALILTALMLLLTLELLIVPPFKNFEFDNVPDLYEEIAEFPKEAAFVFYPLHENGRFGTSQLLFYQRWFRKPMLNGAPDNSDGEALRRTVYNLLNPQTPSVLRRFGVDYLVILEEQFTNLRVARDGVVELPPGLEPTARFDRHGEFSRASVFKITAPAALVVPLYLDDISVPALDREGRTVRLVENVGRVRLENYSGGSLKVGFALPLRNPFSPRTVRVIAGSDVVWKSRLEPEERALAEFALEVPPGGLDIMVEVQGGINLLPLKSMDVFGTRYASLEISDIEVTAAERPAPRSGSARSLR